jgi:citrate synthase
MVCLADHELATSTLAARVAASTRADPTQVVQAGLATMSGPLHGTASLAVHRFLLAAASDPTAALAEQLRTTGRLPGFGHPVHRRGDPRVEPLDAAVRAAATSRQEHRLVLVDRVRALAAERAPVAPNIDFSLGAFGFVAGLAPAATELIFSVARMAGWIAHGLEEYAEAPLRFRARATTSRAS